MVDFERRTFVTGGRKGERRIGLLEAGPAEAAPVIFAHCSLAHAGMWKGVMTALAGTYRCISVDMPAHGGTDPGADGRSMQLQAVADVEVVAEEAGAAHLAGLSFGGAVMGRLAVKRPELTRSVTLIEPVYFHLLQHVNEAARRENEASMREVYSACEAEDFHRAAAAFMDVWGQKGQFARLKPDAQTAIADVLSHLAQDFDMVGGWPEGQITREEISAIAAPLLLVHGENSPGPAKAVLDEIAGLCSTARRAEVKAAGHLSPVDNPAAVAAELTGFFETVA